MSKSQFDFSSAISENAKRLWRDPIEVDVDSLVYSKTNLDEALVKKYVVMDTIPPPVLVIDTGKCMKIVDGHHRVEACKRKKQRRILVYLSSS